MIIYYSNSINFKILISIPNQRYYYSSNNHSSQKSSNSKITTIQKSTIIHRIQLIFFLFLTIIQSFINCQIKSPLSISKKIIKYTSLNNRTKLYKKLIRTNRSSSLKNQKNSNRLLTSTCSRLSIYKARLNNYI